MSAKSKRRTVALDAETERLLLGLAKRFEGNASQAARAAIRLAAAGHGRAHSAVRDQAIQGRGTDKTQEED